MEDSDIEMVARVIVESMGGNPDRLATTERPTTFDNDRLYLPEHHMAQGQPLWTFYAKMAEGILAALAKRDV